MSASSELKGYTKMIHGIPKLILCLIVIGVLLEFSPNQNIFYDIFGAKKETITSENTQDNKSESFLSEYKISNVIDGDTIDITKGEDKKRVRLLGINTPETVDPRRTVECFGREASDYVKTFKNKTVYLELDDTQNTYDKYDRLLAYVYFEDGQMLNRKLLADGYAYEYTYDKPYKYQKDFKDTQRFATAEKRGLWNEDTCNGQK